MPRRSLHALTFVLFALAFLLPDPCLAQGGLAAADSGARIRVLLTGSRIPQEATLVKAGRDSLAIQPGGCCVVYTIPLSSLAAVDVSKGLTISGGRLLSGMAFGLMVGVGAGWAIGEIGCRAPGSSELCGLGILQWMTVLGAGGLLAGGLWGVESKVEQWERIYPPRHASLIVAPNVDRGLSVGMAIPIDFGSGSVSSIAW